MSHMTPVPLLTLSGVSRSFDGHSSVLSDIAFSVAKGEFISVVGPSGCGKSTLLRMIIGLDTPTSGSICSTARNTQMLFQEPALLPWRTLRENVELHNNLSRTNTSTTEVDGVIDAVGLTDHQDKYPHQLSGGMKMRASLARALITDSDLFLFDEPLSAIDELTRESLQELLSSLHHIRNLTCVFVTHNIAEAVYLSDRVLILTPVMNETTQLSHQIPVKIERPRNADHRFQPEFLDTCLEVHRALKEKVS
jgi:NitT/TauT family transport system ATP-binding protein